jgi:AcrR family transcriptional regulator
MVRYSTSQEGFVGKTAKTAESEERAEMRDRVLRAGFAAFRELGFDGASTLEIATRARVSKRELYALFADKQSIVVECIKWRTRQMQVPLALPRPSDPQALLATLTKFGTAAMAGICDPDVLTVFRFAITEAQRTPEIARALDERGREPMRRMFIDLIEKAQEDGLLTPAPPAEVSGFYFSLLWGDLLLRLLMGLVKPPAKAELEQRARHAAERVMAAYAKTGKAR